MLRSRLFLFAVGLTLALLGCSEDVNEIKKEEEKVGEKVIYGDDDRLDLYDVEDKKLLEIADSTVALMQSSKVTKRTDGTVDLTLTSYKTNYDLCEGEPFSDQKLGAFCSGSLVGKDIVITAGHCITSVNSCANTKMIFGFGIKNVGGTTPSNVSEKEVYSCKEIIRRVQSGGIDYAVIRLDREVENHKPLKVYRGEALSNGTGLTVIGHPSGLPTKVASGGSVRNSNDIYYVTNLDTYGGNSGSAVFNSETKEVIGILVRGEEDYVSQGGCYVSNRCKEGACRGEDVTRIDLLTDLIPDESTPTEPEEENITDVFESTQKIAIPDKNAVGIWSVIAVSKIPNGRKIHVYLEIEHTYIGDLQISLVSPAGKSYMLRKNSGGRQKNLVGIYGKELVSLTELGELSKLSVAGNWSLRVADTLSRDVGVLKNWKLMFVP